MRLTNLTRGDEIGANSYLVEAGGRLVVFDAGMHPKKENPHEAIPNLEPIRHRAVDAIFVSHAHLDHLGALPLLMRHQPAAKVFMSEPTYFLAEPILHNSVSVMQKKSIEKKLGVDPVYTRQEIDLACRRMQAAHIGRLWSLRGHPATGRDDGPTFEFFEAGHILGAVSILLRSEEGTLLYTGDINLQNQTLSRRAALPESGVDRLIIETTRGTTDGSAWSRDKEIERLAEHIRTVFHRKGAVMIPVFALGKTQEALAILHRLFVSGALKECPIHIGALSWKFSRIHDLMAEKFPRLMPGLSLLDEVAPLLVDGRSARKLKPRPGEIYLVSSGMMAEKTISNIMAQRFLSDERHGICFIGYTDPDSPAGRLRAAARDGHAVELDPELGPQDIRCTIESIDLTAHAQREDLLDYICKVNPRHTALVHGDPPALAWFQERLAELAPNMRVTVPPTGTAVDFD